MPTFQTFKLVFLIFIFFDNFTFCGQPFINLYLLYSNETWHTYSSRHVECKYLLEIAISISITCENIRLLFQRRLKIISYRVQFFFISSIISVEYLDRYWHSTVYKESNKIQHNDFTESLVHKRVPAKSVTFCHCVWHNSTTVAATWKVMTYLKSAWKTIHITEFSSLYYKK